MTISSLLTQCKMPTSLLCIKPLSFLQNPHNHLFVKPTGQQFRFLKQELVINSGGEKSRGRMNMCNVSLLPIDPWAPNIDSQSIASQLFAFSLFPYIGFLYFITKSKTSPKLTLFGFYFLLAFVGATIPAGIFAKLKYGTSLSNVDWLHGGAESLLTLTNLFIVLGLRQALRNNTTDSKDRTSDSAPALEEEKKSSV